jgi:hypothetical protein
MWGLTLYSHVEHIHVHVHIITLRGEVWIHKTSLTPPLFIEVSVPRDESERSCICVLGVSILLLFLRFFSIGFLNCSFGVVFFVFHFIEIKQLASKQMHRLDRESLESYRIPFGIRMFRKTRRVLSLVDIMRSSSFIYVHWYIWSHI